MHKTQSHSPAARISFAAACAIALGAAAAFAQSTSTPSSPSSPPAADSRDQATTSSDTATANAATTASSGEIAGAPTGRDSKVATTSGKVGFMDRRFVHKAADAGTTELQLAQLAAERATSPEVKSYAQKLVQDHSMVNSELTSLAGQKSIKLDDDEGKDRYYNRLSKKSGADFDQEFIDHMVDEHEDAVKLFEKASTDAKDAEIRSFASKHVGHLRDHLQQAQSLRSTIVPTGAMDSSSGRSRYSPNNDATSTTPGSQPVSPKTDGSDRSGNYTKPGPSSSGTTTNDTPRNDPSR